MMIGKTGQYVRKFKNAMSFKDKIDSLEYVDKHGYNRIATVRAVGRNKTEVLSDTISVT